ncbi:hypothetical protein VSU19_23050 [Verrucomicrobiales bacterium BCK34]|nr:hypothetical protein [Verrucomicrobiales bacterium BCK34]
MKSSAEKRLAAFDADLKGVKDLYPVVSNEGSLSAIGPTDSTPGCHLKTAAKSRSRNSSGSGCILLPAEAPFRRDVF